MPAASWASPAPASSTSPAPARRRHPRPPPGRQLHILAAWLVAAAALSLGACSRAHYAVAGDRAWRDGDAAGALAHWRAALRHERSLIDEAERRTIEERVGEAVEQLLRPALAAAQAATARGDGARALEILLPLYARKGLLRYLAEPELPAARQRLLDPIRAALTVEAGIDVKALEENSSAIVEAGERIKALSQRLKVVAERDRAPLEAMLDDLATPALERGWQIVDRLLREGRLVEAISFAHRILSVRPQDSGQRARHQASLSRARQAQQRLLDAIPRDRPGLRWAAGELVRRFGGAGEPGVEAELRKVSYRVAGGQICPDLGNSLASALQRGSGGVAVELEVMVGSCQASDRRWETRERIAWNEERTREVPYVERYTEYVSRQKCEYVQVYANTTCHTDYYTKRQVCRDNSSTMQRCRTVSEPVTRERRGTRIERYTVRRTGIRTNYHQATGFVAQGSVTLRWPGGGSSVPFSYRDSSQDYAFRDEAGQRSASVRSVDAMKRQAIDQLRGRVHGHDGQALQPKAAGLRAAAGDADLALDRALQAFLLGTALRPAEVAHLSRWLNLPAQVAAAPRSYANGGDQVAIRGERPAAQSGGKRKADGGMASLFGGGMDEDNHTPVQRLIDPSLPEPDRGLARMYQELSQTAFSARDRRAHTVMELRLGGAQAPLDASKIGLSLQASLAVAHALRLELGGDIERAGLGTRGVSAGVALGLFDPAAGGQVGWHLRYSRQDVTGAAAGAARGHSALDVGLRGRFGSVVGLAYEFNFNIARLAGDDSLAHWHRQTAALFLSIGRVALEGGGSYWVSGGGWRWHAAVVFRL